jgi:phosphatidylglycerol lysyltransferase
LLTRKHQAGTERRRNPRRGPLTSRRGARLLLSALCFIGAIWGIQRGLAGHSYREIVRSAGALSLSRLAVAVLSAAGSYVALGVGDAVAIRCIGRRLSWRRLAVSSFVGNAFANSVGLASVGGAPVRLRFLSAWGFAPLEAGQVVIFCCVTRLVGYLALAGVLFVAQPLALPPALASHVATARPLGVACLALVLAYLTWAFWRRTPLRAAGVAFEAPRPTLALAQVTASSIDWLCCAATLYALLGAGGGAPFAGLLQAFLLAQVVGYLSGVPGGLGVFEGAFLLLLPAGASRPSAAAALIAFRGLYYLLPIVLATVVMAAEEIAERPGLARRLAGSAKPQFVPELFALATFGAGIVLLLSGSTPAAAGRLVELHHYLPLPLVEVSHFLASLTGVALLVLSRGLHRRLDAAWLASLLLLAAGAVFSLAKGFDYEEAGVLAALFAALLPCRRHFYRPSSLLQVQPEGQWIAAMLLVVAASAWLATFSHRHAQYTAESWWRFALDSEAPRSLRAAVGAAVALMALALVRLFGAPPSRPSLPDAGELEAARAIATASTNTYAYLVLRRDKAILFSPARNAFLMYGMFDRSFVAMGDPIGPIAEARELVWRFRELCDRAGRWPVFFEVRPKYADLYLEAGLGLWKLGEEARVLLPGFAIEAPEHANLRRARSRLQRAGCVFEIVPQSAVATIVSELRGVSDAWLAEKATREKGFSNAAFSEEYVAVFPVAVVRREGRILAFANVWPGAENEELSVDLMRFVPDAPTGVMDYLFTELMSWGRERGFRWFNLGMAPLAGLEGGREAPIWESIATFLFRHGEHFYNFQGVRRYKAKFGPQWEARFLASPGGLALPRVIVDVTALIAGGLAGIVKK